MRAPSVPKVLHLRMAVKGSSRCSFAFAADKQAARRTVTVRVAPSSAWVLMLP